MESRRVAKHILAFYAELTTCGGTDSMNVTMDTGQYLIEIFQDNKIPQDFYLIEILNDIFYSPSAMIIRDIEMKQSHSLKSIFTIFHEVSFYTLSLPFNNENLIFCRAQTSTSTTTLIEVLDSFSLN